MKNKSFLLCLFALTLTGCSKVNELYSKNAYNSSVFDENYYVDFDGLNTLELDEKSYEANYQKVEKFESCLIEKNQSFGKGILSKLYDGRTECGSLYQLSRVQVNKSGFGDKFPITITDASSFCFAARGGSSLDVSLNKIIHFNFHITLLSKAEKIIYNLTYTPIPTDMGGITYLYEFNLEDKIDIIGFTFSFECLELPEGVSDDYLDTSKEHLSIMLYEVYIY